ATAIYPAAPARLDEIRVVEGERVNAGDPLFALSAPDLTQELSQTRLRIAIAQTTLMRDAAMPDGAVRAGVSEERLASDLATWRGLAERARRVQAVAPHDGIVRDVARGLSPGVWVAMESPLFRIVEGPARLTAYVDAADLGRIDTGLRGRFLPDDPAARSLEVEIVNIAVVAETELDIASFADIHGGPIAASRDEQGRLIPSRAVWRVELALVEDDEAEPPASAVPGKVRFSVPGEAPIARVFRNVAAIVIRESWF
ncbi:MAG TPA: HlyD family efflux transporter periplasmic adaptor subunit, partial [Saliniramus sp.]|nr:HlyD family efflux transporter periplasmic adaptor subunit [Saliniramus sp.]